MGYTHTIPLISTTAGDGGIGHLLGTMPQTLHTTVLLNIKLAGTLYSYSYDKGTGGSLTNISSTIDANQSTAGGFPFGSVAANISNGDIFYAGCDHKIDRMFVQVLTAGVGTWTATLYDSSDGIKAGRALSGVNDPSNGFKTLGTHEITFTAPSPDALAFSPQPDDSSITSRRFIAFKLSGVSGVSVAPKIRVWIMHDNAAITWLDMTGVYNSSMTDGNFAGFPATYLPIVGSEVLYITTNPMLATDMAIHRKQAANVATWVHEYSISAAGARAILSDITDPAANFSVGPTTLGDPVQTFRSVVIPPADWVSATVTLPMSTGSNQTFTGYMHWARSTAVNVPGPTTTPLSRMRVRQFGNVNTQGIKVPAATTIKGITIREPLSTGGSGTNGLQVLNLTTGKSSPVTIPASPSWPITWPDVDAGNTFTQLSLAAGDKYDVVCTTGTRTFTSVEITLHI